MKTLSEMNLTELAAAAANCESAYNPYEARYEELLAAELATKKDSFADEWTLEVTAERRAAFNTGLKARGGRKLTAKQMKDLIAKIESELGYTIEALKQAVKNHGM